MPATDNFANAATGLTSPARNAMAITPNDGTDLASVTRGIYVGVSGDIALVTAGGQTVTFKTAAQGSTIPIQAARVLSTGTTATNLIGLY